MKVSLRGRSATSTALGANKPICEGDARASGTPRCCFERCAGLDVHKDTVVAWVRVPGPGGRRERHGHEASTTTAGLAALRDWLAAHRISRVGVEATGTYRKPVHHMLEDQPERWLPGARHLRDVPGRTSGPAGAAWIRRLVEHGLVRPSFVPPAPIRELRALARDCKAQIEERAREAQRLDKALQDAGIKLSSVASEILGVSGRQMPAAPVGGERDPETLAELARGARRRKLPQLGEALAGCFFAHHALLVGEILAKLDHLEEAIERLSAEIEAVIAPFGAQVELLRSIPGVDRRMAGALVAEIGVDMSRFGSSARLASWAGLCPGQHESAGRRRHGATRKGSKWLRAHLTQAAKGAVRTRGTCLSAQYARLKGRRGQGRATIAAAHSILVAAFHILERGTPYEDLGADWVIRRHRPRRHARKLVHQLGASGFAVQIQGRAAA